MDFIIMFGAFLLVAVGAVMWLVYLRKPKKRRRKYRHRHRHQSAPITLAQTGGLPPIRREEQPPPPPPTTEI
ncbi:MAG TPA: hypothetical protein VMB80_15010 [Candidatus Acidoferrum sp.]|nr:hypothetical protein [Candidatus Acidoferrum sp.]